MLLCKRLTKTDGKLHINLYGIIVGQPTDIFCLFAFHLRGVQELLNSMKTSHSHSTVLIKEKQRLEDRFELVKVRYYV